MLYDEYNNYYDHAKLEPAENYDFLNPTIEQNNTNFNLNNNMEFDIENLNINTFRHHAKSSEPTEGLNKGTLFDMDYKPYKNHCYSVRVSGRKDGMLLKIQSLSFAIKDLNLYLDLHPNELDKVELLKRYVNEAEQLKVEYSKEYEPLCLEYAQGTQKFDWINNPWPWDKGGAC